MTRSTELGAGLVLATVLGFASEAAAQTRCPAGQIREAGACVSSDRDGDGIPDDLDRCPADAEDANGFQDEDGCPDEPLRARNEAARAAASAREASEARALVERCFDSAELRARSFREGFTSVDSAIEAARACATRYPDSSRTPAARATIAQLEGERDRLAHGRAEEERRSKLALAEGYRAKARVQYALGTSFAVISAGAATGAVAFVLAQPLGDDDIKNTIAGSVCLGFAVMFGVETYLRFAQGLTHERSAKNIRPVALGPSGVSIAF